MSCRLPTAESWTAVDRRLKVSLLTYLIRWHRPTSPTELQCHIGLQVMFLLLGFCRDNALGKVEPCKIFLCQKLQIS